MNILISPKQKHLFGKISFKEGEYQTTDVVYCPFCSADIYEEEDLEEVE
jgi:hypothetical protein